MAPFSCFWRLFVFSSLFAPFGESRSPCKVKAPTTEEPSTIPSTLTSTTTAETVATSTTVSPNSPCMKVWPGWDPDDASYADYTIATKTASSPVECGSICESDAECGYSYHLATTCYTFPKFTPFDFVNTQNGASIIKLYLNGTGYTCDTASLVEMASAKTKMFYPEGGSYWLFPGIMDEISYGSNNPALGYKRRRKRSSLFSWLFSAF